MTDTDTELNIAIAERKGWTTIERVHDRLMGISPDGVVAVLPTYTADPREWAKLLEEIVEWGHGYEIVSPTPGQESSPYYLNVYPFDEQGKVLRHDGLAERYAVEAPTLGRAVAEGWWACNGGGAG